VLYYMDILPKFISAGNLYPLLGESAGERKI